MPTKRPSVLCWHATHFNKVLAPMGLVDRTTAQTITLLPKGAIKNGQTAPTKNTMLTSRK